MNTSNNKANGQRRKNGWIRRTHRWLGGGLAVFVLLLSCTGIALNHSDDWNLDGRYVSWSWLLNAYGIHAPAPAASFSDGEHFAVLLGQRLYYDQREIADGVDSLSGMIATPELALVASNNRAFVLTLDGDLVEQLELSQRLPGAIERVGRFGDRAVILSNGSQFRSDADMTGFEAWQAAQNDNIAWSRADTPPADLLNALNDQYRGRGVSAERLVSDLHSGRFLGRFGTLFMDAIGILLIILSATGIILWVKRSGRRNGRESKR